MVRLLSSLLFATALLGALSGASAGAQSTTDVQRGSTFAVENAGECRANAEVTLSFTGSDDIESIVGSTIADRSGHFRFETQLAATAPLGAGAITALCGLDDLALVFDVVVVEATDRGAAGLVPFVVGAVALVLVAVLVIWRRSKRDADGVPDEEAQVPDDQGPSLLDLADAEADQEEDPDYWIWDMVTGRGPVKRLACLSAHGFYLHEVVADDFQTTLERLAADGPDLVLADAFFAVSVVAIDEVHRRGPQLRVVFHEQGERLARVIDLGSEVEGVVDLLSRRVQVLAPESVAGS